MEPEDITEAYERAAALITVCISGDSAALEAVFPDSMNRGDVMVVATAAAQFAAGLFAELCPVGVDPADVWPEWLLRSRPRWVR